MTHREATASPSPLLTNAPHPRCTSLPAALQRLPSAPTRPQAGSAPPWAIHPSCLRRKHRICGRPTPAGRPRRAFPSRTSLGRADAPATLIVRHALAAAMLDLDASDRKRSDLISRRPAPCFLPRRKPSRPGALHCAHLLSRPPTTSHMPHSSSAPASPPTPAPRSCFGTLAFPCQRPFAMLIIRAPVYSCRPITVQLISEFRYFGGALFSPRSIHRSASSSARRGSPRARQKYSTAS